MRKFNAFPVMYTIYASRSFSKHDEGLYHLRAFVRCGALTMCAAAQVYASC